MSSTLGSPASTEPPRDERWAARPVADERLGWRSLAAACAASPGLLVGAAIVASFAFWAYHDGGFATVDLAPAALFLVALGTVVTVVSPPRRFPPPAVLAATGFLAAFTIWSFLSIGWAGVESDALTGANRTLIYLVVFALVAMVPWRTGAAVVVLASFGLATAVVALVSFWQVVEAGDAASFREGRLASPILYANGTGALCAMAAIGSVYLASRRELPALLRGALVAATCVLVEVGLLAQSRGSLVTVPLILALLVALAPGRIRLALTVGAVGLVVLLALPALLDVYDVVIADEDPADALARARRALVASAFAAGLGGTLVAWLDGSRRVPPRIATLANRVALVAVAVVAIGVAGTLLATDPVTRAGDAWDHFRNEEYVSAPGTPHLTSGFGSTRYSVWRVAVDQFREHPVVGVGVDNFAVDYLRERGDQAQPQYPHSVVLRTLSQTGLVGGMLLLGFLVAAGIAVVAGLRRGTAMSRGVVAAGTAVCTYWLVHGTIDWFWEIPALAAPAFAFLGIAMQTSDRDLAESPPPRARATRALAVGAIVVALAATLAIAPPWLAAREIDTAAASWPADPSAAYARLDRARSIDRLTDEADVIESLIASRLRDDARQERALLRALERNPVNWYPMVELAALATRRDAWTEADRWLDRAAALNPREVAITFVRDHVSEKEAVPADELQELFVQQVTLITGEKQAD